MKHTRWLVPILVLLGGQAELPAQIVLSPYGPGYLPGPGVGISYHSRRLTISGYLPSSPYYPLGAYPYSPYYGYPSYRSVTYIYTPAQSVAPPSPPITINNQPIVIVGAAVDREDDGEFIRIVPRRRNPPRSEERRVGKECRL